MRCPKCGSINLDDAEACDNCGVRFRRKVTVKRHVVLKDAREVRRLILTRHVLLPLGISLSAALGALLVAVLLLSPWVSPLDTVRDRDGDGHPDAFDSAPTDPQFWSMGSALVVVTVTSNHTFTGYDFTLYVDDAAYASGQVPAGGSAVANIQLGFLTGSSFQSQVVLTLRATDGSVGQRQMVVENGRSYGVGFIIPI